MALYPLNVELQNRLCVVVGGGGVAARKAEGLLRAGAEVVLISPEITKKIASLLVAPGIEWRARRFRGGDLAGAFLAYAATDSKEVQNHVAAEAKRCGVLLNSADNPADSDFHLPACFRRGEILVTAATGGKSPALAAKLRKTLEETVGDEYRIAAELLGLLRQRIVTRDSDSSVNGKIFTKITEGGLVELGKAADWDGIRRLLDDSLRGSAVKIDTAALLRDFLRSRDKETEV